MPTAVLRAETTDSQTPHSVERDESKVKRPRAPRTPANLLFIGISPMSVKRDGILLYHNFLASNNVDALIGFNNLSILYYLRYQDSSIGCWSKVTYLNVYILKYQGSLSGYLNNPNLLVLYFSINQGSLTGCHNNITHTGLYSLTCQGPSIGCFGNANNYIWTPQGLLAGC